MRFKMMTAEQIEGMNPEQRQQALDRFAQAYFNSNQWKKPFAEMTGTTQAGIGRWFRESPPVWPLVLMSALCENQDLKHALKTYFDARKHAEELAAQL